MLTGLLLSVSCAAPGGQPDPGPPAPREGGGVAVDPADPPDLSRSQPSRPPTTSDTVKLSFGGDVMFEDDLRELLETAGDRPGPDQGRDRRRGLHHGEPRVRGHDPGHPRPEGAGGRRQPLLLPDQPGTHSPRCEAAGVDAVSVANNHGADFGADGTGRHAASQGAAVVVPVLGVGRNRAEAFRPHRVTLKGQPFAFFAADDSFLESTEPYWQAGPTTPGLAAARGPGRSALLTAVERAAAGGAAVVVYLHWGKENSTAVTAEQKRWRGHSREPGPPPWWEPTPTGCRARDGSSPRTWRTAWATSSGTTGAGATPGCSTSR